MPKRPLLPLVEMPLDGEAAIRLEGRGELRGERWIEDAHADLVVELERAVVEVRRADARPDTVDDHDLLMDQRALKLPDLYAALQQRAELMVAGVLHDRAVGRRRGRHHDPHVDAAL